MRWVYDWVKLSQTMTNDDSNDKRLIQMSNDWFESIWIANGLQQTKLVLTVRYAYQQLEIDLKVFTLDHDLILLHPTFDCGVKTHHASIHHSISSYSASIASAILKGK